MQEDREVSEGKGEIESGDESGRVRDRELPVPEHEQRQDGLSHLPFLPHKTTPAPPLPPARVETITAEFQACSRPSQVATSRNADRPTARRIAPSQSIRIPLAVGGLVRFRRIMTNVKAPGRSGGKGSAARRRRPRSTPTYPGASLGRRVVVQPAPLESSPRTGCEAVGGQGYGHLSGLTERTSGPLAAGRLQEGSGVGVDESGRDRHVQPSPSVPNLKFVVVNAASSDCRGRDRAQLLPLRQPAATKRVDPVTPTLHNGG